MTVLGLILGIEAAGLAFALYVARTMARRDADALALKRLGGALLRAARSFLGRQYRQIALLALGILLVLAAAPALVRVLVPGPAGATHSLLLGGVSFVAGAVLAAVVGLFAALVGIRGGMSVVSAARTSLDGALSSAVRAGAASGLFSETLSVLGPGAVFALAYAVRGGFTLPHDQARALAAELVLSLPPFVLGAALSALVLQRGGAAYHASSDVGGDLAGESEAGLEHDDPRNPALVSDLVGDQLGVGASRAVAVFAGQSAIGVALALLALRLNGSLLALGLLPLLVRAFGLVACATGLLVVRTDEATHPEHALLRGYASALVVLSFGLGAATYALLGSSGLPLFAAGLLGPLAAGAAAAAGKIRLLRGRGPLKQALDTLRVGAGVSIAAGLAAGLQAALVPVTLLAVSVGSAWLLGARSGLPGGAELGLVTWLATLAALTPFALAVSTSAAVADSARGMAVVGTLDPEARRRSARVDDAGFGAAAVSDAYVIMQSALSVLGIALALSVLVTQKLEAAPAALASPLLVCSGALGAALVLAYAGSVARHAARGAREVALEVERQLRGFPREQGLAQIPPEYTPSYRSCEELTAKNALAGVLPGAAYLLIPVLLGAALGLMYRTSSPRLLADGLTAFVTVAAVTGLGVALVVDGARVALSSTRRATRPQGASAHFRASVTGDAVADILGNVAGPAAQLMGKAGAALLLSLAPFLL